jgi:transposase
MALRVLITKATQGDCKQAGVLIEGFKAKGLLADRGYDSNQIIKQAQGQGMKAVIPPRKHRKEQREYDKEVYKLRGVVEHGILALKRWRGIASRYAKKASSFLAAIQIRCLGTVNKVFEKQGKES